MNIVQLRHSSSNQCAGSLALAGDINGKGHEQLENHDTSLIRVIYARKYAWTVSVRIHLGAPRDVVLFSNREADLTIFHFDISILKKMESTGKAVGVWNLIDGIL